MKFLITGGSGFIGRRLIRSLLQDSNHVLHLGLNQLSEQSCYTFVDYPQLSSIASHPFFESNDDFIVYICLSWQGIPNYTLSNGISNICHLTNEFSVISKIQSIKKIIVTGSCFEYSDRSKPNDELSQDNSIDYLGWAKSAVRESVRLIFGAEKSISWLRLFYVYGPEQGEKTLFNFVVNSYNSGELFVPRTPLATVDYIHVDDVVAFIANLSCNKLSKGFEIFNVGSGISYKVGDITNYINRKLSGETGEIDLIPVDGGFCSRTVHSKLSWKPIHNLKNQLDSISQWI